MEIGAKIKVGYAQDWTGQATYKYQIVAETIEGSFLCRQAPFIVSRPDGTKYVASSMTGLFLRSKEEFSDIHEEMLK